MYPSLPLVWKHLRIYGSLQKGYDSVAPQFPVIFSTYSTNPYHEIIIVKGKRSLWIAND